MKYFSFVKFLVCNQATSSFRMGDMSDDKVEKARGVSDLWADANHIAIVVKDVGKSLQFYTDVVGMKQILRPDFDR